MKTMKDMVLPSLLIVIAMKDLSAFLCGNVFAVASLKPAKLNGTTHLFIVKICCIVLILFVLRRLDL